MAKTRKAKRLTGNPLRELPFLAWKNNSAPLETMRGAPWKRALAQEKRYFNTLLTSRVKSLAKQFQKELEVTSGFYSLDAFTLGDGAIIITMTGSDVYWRWAWSKITHLTSDLDFYENKVYYIQVDKNDGYKSDLFCQDDAGRILWSKKGISGQVDVHDGLCYYVDVEYPFNTTRLMCCDAATGRNSRVVLEDKDEERFLGLSPASGNTLYCVSTVWGESKTWRIEGSKATRIHAGTRLQVPLGLADSGEECGLLVKKGSSVYEPYGATLLSWAFPPKEHEPQWVNVRSGHMLTRFEGDMRLWYCQPHKNAIELYRILGGLIQPNPFVQRLDLPYMSFYVMEPSRPPYIMTALAKSPHLHQMRRRIPTHPSLFALRSQKYYAKSADGTSVPYLYVQHGTSKVKALLCYAYSAYGATTPVTWPLLQWGPLLERGFAVAYAFCRGGGDLSLAWTDAGRREKHIRTVEDIEAVLQAAQRHTGLPPAKTILYGRSAGGMMAGSVLARHADGDLMGTVFTEVPFVDTMRTQTNRSIDLTPSGMSEYGSPDKSPMHFGAMLALSPLYNLPARGAPGVQVLCRTGLKDRQVLPFEPVKWIRRLRGAEEGPANKFLSYEPDEAHVYTYAAFHKARAIDLAILLTWLEKK